MPYPKENDIRTNLGRVRGLGSAKEGTHHWMMVKVSAIALIPLTLWFFFSMMCMIGSDASFEAALAWVQKPYNSLLMVIFLGMNFYHAAISGQEIIVDYVPNHKIQIPALLLYKGLCYGFGILSVFSVLYITFKL